MLSYYFRPWCGDADQTNRQLESPARRARHATPRRRRAAEASLPGGAAATEIPRMSPAALLSVWHDTEGLDVYRPYLAAVMSLLIMIAGIGALGA